MSRPIPGPASAYGIIGKTEEAYFKMINDQGGINGRKINWISYDDGYSPPKTVEQIRKLIESDEVFLVFNALGTPTQTAVQKYHNAKKVPQLFLATGASKWNDPKDFPWTMGFQPSYRVEARIFAKYILKEKPDAKVAIFYANDDFGKDYVAGIKEIFGAKAASQIVAEESYETTEPSIDGHIVKLKGTGADVLVNISTPKFAAQAIKKMAELEWKPMHLMTDVSISIGAVMKPAGFDASQGILSAGYLKDASDPQWKDDAGMKKFMAFVDKYMPGANISDANLVYGFAAAQTMVEVLKKCGDNLTRENPVVDFIPCDRIVFEHARDLEKRDPAAVEDVRDLGHRTGLAVRQPFAGHLRAVPEAIEPVIVNGCGGREIQNDDRNLGPPDHREHGGRERIGCDMKKNEINVSLTELMSGSEGLFGSINQPEVHYLGSRLSRASGRPAGRILSDDLPGRETAANTHPARFQRAQSSTPPVIWARPLVSRVADGCRHKSYSLQTAEL